MPFCALRLFLVLRGSIVRGYSLARFFCVLELGWRSAGWKAMLVETIEVEREIDKGDAGHVWEGVSGQCWWTAVAVR